MTLTVKGLALDDVFGDMARVHLSHRPNINAGQLLVLSHNNVALPLVARGAPNNQKDHIWLDLATRERLGDLALDTAYDFTIEKATFGDILRWAWKATNPAYRVASQISIVSAVLGIIGLLLGIISLIVAFK